MSPVLINPQPEQPGSIASGNPCESGASAGCVSVTEPAVTEPAATAPVVPSPAAPGRHESGDPSPAGQLGVILVIYNKLCQASPSAVFLRQLDDPGVLTAVIDNSTDEATITANRAFCSGFFTYQADGCNKGLSRAYNLGWALLRPLVACITLLDDDTALQDDHFSLLRQAMTAHPDVTVWLPAVFDEAGLLSPCRRLSCLFFRLRQRPGHFGRHHSAINAGMAVSVASVSRSAGDRLFDEDLFLDCIDHLFISRIMRHGGSIAIFDAICRQAFFDQQGRRASQERHAAFVRFCIYSRDYLAFAYKAGYSRILARTALLTRAVRLSLRFGSVRFFRCISHKTAEHEGVKP